MLNFARAVVHYAFTVLSIVVLIHVDQLSLVLCLPLWSIPRPYVCLSGVTKCFAYSYLFRFWFLSITFLWLFERYCIRFIAFYEFFDVAVLFYWAVFNFYLFLLFMLFRCVFVSGIISMINSISLFCKFEFITCI